MSTDTLLQLVLAALLVFWAVGAHNRLVRLKNAVGQAYAPLDVHLRERQGLLSRLLEGEPRPEPDLHAQFALACRGVQAALDQARLRPSGGPEAQALQAAERQLDERLAQLWQSPALREACAFEGALRELVLELARLDDRTDVVAQPYQQAVQAYNEAVQEFPAWLIGRLAGLKPLPGLSFGDHVAARQAARPMMVGRREGDPPTASDI